MSVATRQGGDQPAERQQDPQAENAFAFFKQMDDARRSGGGGGMEMGPSDSRRSSLSGVPLPAKESSSLRSPNSPTLSPTRSGTLPSSSAVPRRTTEGQLSLGNSREVAALVSAKTYQPQPEREAQSPEQEQMGLSIGQLGGSGTGFGQGTFAERLPGLSSIQTRVSRVSFPQPEIEESKPESGSTDAAAVSKSGGGKPSMLVFESSRQGGGDRDAKSKPQQGVESRQEWGREVSEAQEEEGEKSDGFGDDDDGFGTFEEAGEAGSIGSSQEPSFSEGGSVPAGDIPGAAEPPQPAAASESAAVPVLGKQHQVPAADDEQADLLSLPDAAFYAEAKRLMAASFGKADLPAASELGRGRTLREAAVETKPGHLPSVLDLDLLQERKVEPICWRGGGAEASLLSLLGLTEAAREAATNANRRRSSVSGSGEPGRSIFSSSGSLVQEDYVPCTGSLPGREAPSPDHAALAEAEQLSQSQPATGEEDVQFDLFSEESAVPVTTASASLPLPPKPAASPSPSPSPRSWWGARLFGSRVSRTAENLQGAAPPEGSASFEGKLPREASSLKGEPPGEAALNKAVEAAHAIPGPLRGSMSLPAAPLSIRSPRLGRTPQQPPSPLGGSSTLQDRGSLTPPRDRWSSASGGGGISAIPGHFSSADWAFPQGREEGWSSAAGEGETLPGVEAQEDGRGATPALPSLEVEDPASVLPVAAGSSVGGEFGLTDAELLASRLPDLSFMLAADLPRTVVKPVEYEMHGSLI